MITMTVEELIQELEKLQNKKQIVYMQVDDYIGKIGKVVQNKDRCILEEKSQFDYGFSLEDSVTPPR